MFKDREEELKRLEEELLEEELQEQPDEYEEDEEYDEEYEEEPENDADEDATRMFTPVSRTYRVKNTDRTDVDLERYSKEVEEGTQSNRGLAILLLLLCVGVAAVLLYYVLRLRGYVS